MPLDLRHLVERAKESEPGADVSTPEKVVAAFDARSLCKLVVVPFEKQLLKGRPFAERIAQAVLECMK